MALVLACVALTLAVALPVLAAGRSRLTSDESLYTAEALNIATGRGLTYTTGTPISHRAPLYPAILAVELRAGGLSLDRAYLVPGLAVVANALLVFWLARKLFGSLAGMVAGTLAASSPYVSGLGTTLFLDGLESTFILGSLIAYWRACEAPSLGRHVAAGCLLGIAFLIKESALLLLPLPLIMPLLAGRQRGWRAGIAGWTTGFVAATGWWWAWVLWHTHAVYLLGSVNDQHTRLAVATAAAAVAAVAAALSRAGRELRPRPSAWTRVTACVLFAAWAGIFIAGLEWQSWQHPGTYLADVPDYAMNVLLPAVRPAPLFAAAWLWAAVSAARGDRGAALIAAAGGLVLPFAVFVASRGLSLRDMLPLIYLSCVVLSGAASRLVAWGEKLAREGDTAFPARAGLAVVVASMVTIGLLGLGRVDRSSATSPEGDWDNELAHSVADWLDANVQPGTSIMSTRLYYSHVYFLTGGRYPIRQLPTAEVTLRPQGPSPLARRGALFRWEGPRLGANSPDDVWLYLTLYPEKGYYVGLAESDLIHELKRDGTGYLVVSVSDAGFSSPALVPYFDQDPAFSKVFERRLSDADAVRVYRVNLEALGPGHRPTAVSAAALGSIEGRLGPDGAAGFLRGLSPSGFEVWPW